MTSIALAGYGLGGVIWNPLETAYVNPNNIAVQDVPGEDDKYVHRLCNFTQNHINLPFCTICRYFLDKNVLDRVPSMFLMLGGIFASMELLAVLLIREPSNKEVEEIMEFAQKHQEQNEQKSEIKENLEAFSLNPKEMLKTKEFYQVHTQHCKLFFIL